MRRVRFAVVAGRLRSGPMIHHRLQDRLAALIGVSPLQRRQRLESLLRPPEGDAVGYWLQLAISVLIATLGLAQGSTAVVIGAMLIAPLMQPIVELGFGLALGSPLLVFRAAARVAGSLVIALGASAAITHALPFHELTPELLARTSPTMLDLFVAGACALAAVYTTVRSSGETASAAAGTAIGISLVPPLCAAGWGIGTQAWDVAQGAALLFTANLTAIIMLTMLSVLGLGYGQVDVRAMEAGELASEGRHGRARHVARVSAKVSERVLGRYVAVFFRILLPVAMLAAIYVPLRAALGEVAWQSSARGYVRTALAPHRHRMVEQALEVRRGKIHLSLIAIGDRETNEGALAELSAEVERHTGARPLIDATYVPDSDALASLARSVPTAPPPVVEPPPPPPPGPRFATTLTELVAARWPAHAGPLLATRIRFASPPAVELVHLGPELGPAARDLLTPELSGALGLPVQVDERALPAEALTVASGATAPELAGWLGATAELLDAARDLDVVACLEAPAVPPPPPRRRPPPPDPVREMAVAALEARARASTRRELAYTDRWSVRFAKGSCGPADVPPVVPPPAAPPALTP